MSKKIVLSVPVEVTVRDRDVKLLGVIDRLTTHPDRGVTLSHARLARELDASPDTLRRAIASCCEEGYLHVTENWLSNGGRLSNSYSLTAEGAALAKAARAAQLVA